MALSIFHIWRTFFTAYAYKTGFLDSRLREWPRWMGLIDILDGAAGDYSAGDSRRFQPQILRRFSSLIQRGFRRKNSAIVRWKKILSTACSRIRTKTRKLYCTFELCLADSIVR